MLRGADISNLNACTSGHAMPKNPGQRLGWPRPQTKNTPEVHEERGARARSNYQWPLPEYRNRRMPTLLGWGVSCLLARSLPRRRLGSVTTSAASVQAAVAICEGRSGNGLGEHNTWVVPDKSCGATTNKCDGACSGLRKGARDAPSATNCNLFWSTPQIYFVDSDRSMASMYILLEAFFVLPLSIVFSGIWNFVRRKWWDFVGVVCFVVRVREMARECDQVKLFLCLE